MSTWLVRFDVPANEGARLAVKDAIDVAGVPTTAACPIIGDKAVPAERDAPVVATARAQGARIVGKTNLTELCRAADGVNPWTGTPENPLDPACIPGGSSSGSAVAVAIDEADVGYGTDTGGSVRVPAACCGVTGLKTTHGRVSVDGVFPLSASLDTVGPIGRDVAAVVLGMRLIEPGFAATPAAGSPDIGRLRPAGIDIDPAIDAAVDAALRAAGLTPVDEPITDWRDAIEAGIRVLLAEGYREHRELLAHPDRMSGRIRRRIEAGAEITDGMVDHAYHVRAALRTALGALLERYQVLALPTLLQTPPRIGAERDVPLTDLTVPINLVGLPALALPVPLPGSHLMASLQLIGPANGEEVLVGIGAMVEAALRS